MQYLHLEWARDKSEMRKRGCLRTFQAITVIGVTDENFNVSNVISDLKTSQTITVIGVTDENVNVSNVISHLVMPNKNISSIYRLK